jgi:hypothetical protein
VSEAAAERDHATYVRAETSGLAGTGFTASDFAAVAKIPGSSNGARKALQRAFEKLSADEMLLADMKGSGYASVVEAVGEVVVDAVETAQVRRVVLMNLTAIQEKAFQRLATDRAVDVMGRGAGCLEISLQSSNVEAPEPTTRTPTLYSQPIDTAGLPPEPPDIPFDEPVADDAPEPVVDVPVEESAGGFCTQCGAGLVAGHRFCRQCGNTVS